MQRTARRAAQLAAVTFTGLAATMWFPAPAAHALAIFVTSTADGTLAALASNGTCDLREAVEAANTDTAVGECAAGASGADVVTFSLGGCPCTIALADGVLVITDNVTIEGPGAAHLTIDAGGTSRVLDVDGASAAVNRISLANGFHSSFGGGVRVGVNSAFSGSGLWLRDNTVGPEGECLDCAVGGAVAVAGESGLTLVASAITDNRAVQGSGGGIFAGNSSTSLRDVTISGNTADVAGGGIAADGTYGTVWTNNVTITANSATIAGGVSSTNEAEVYLANTILAGNTALAAPDCAVGEDSVLESNDYNLFGDPSDCDLAPAPHDRTGEPGLAALSGNGAATPTHALLDTSQAVDAGNPDLGAEYACLSYDQRGVARPIDGDLVPGAICDIGAYEKAALPPPIATPTTQATVPPLPNTGLRGSLATTAAAALASVLAGAAVMALVRHPRTG